MAIRIGSTSIGKVYKGATPITKIYKGVTLLYSSGTAYETETVALLARAAVQPSAALADLINTTIKGLKDDGVFALGDCLYIRGVHEAQLACQNWIKNAHNSTLVNSPTFTAKVGFTGDGATKYINDNYKPSTEAVNMVNNSCSLVYCSPALGTTTLRSPLGALNTSTPKYYFVVFQTAAGERGYLYTSNANEQADTVNGDYLGFSRTGITVQAYKNGSPIGTNQNIAETYSLVDYNIFELGRNLNGSLQIPYNGSMGFSFFGGFLDATKQLALYTRLAYFYANVGGTF